MASVNRMANAIESLSVLAGESGATLETIVALSNSATMEVHAIATASQEQSAASDEINRAIAEINLISMETARVMALSSDAVNNVARQAGTLQHVIGDMRSSEAWGGAWALV